jgi:hypothetical protein
MEPHLRSARGHRAQAAVLALWNAIVLRDKVDPKRAHNAFLNIDEYCDAVEPGIARPVH